MMLAIPLVHIFMSLMFLALPYVTRREILFGVVVPSDFRSRPEGCQTVHSFLATVAIGAAVGLLTMLISSRVGPAMLLGPATVAVTAISAFIRQNRNVKPFAVRSEPVRELELAVAPDRLPGFAWIGLTPIVLLGGTALYLHAVWDQLSDPSFRDIYGPLVLGAAMVLWLFGLGLATWYGSRRSEPLRKPILGVFAILAWILALFISAMVTQPILKLSALPAMVLFMAAILSSVVFLIVKARGSKGPIDPTPAECWKGGMVYYNPNDPVLFVGRRDGAGFTFNLGNRWSWVVMLSPLLLALPMLFF